MKNKVLLAVTFIILLSVSVTNFVLNKKSNNEKDLIQSTFVNYIKENMDDKTAFLYGEAYTFPIGDYNVLFPDNEHYGYVTRFSKLNKLHQTVLENMDYIRITNISDIDSRYTQIFCPEHFDGKYNIMRVPSDSTEIVKHFEIKEKIICGSLEYSLYRLERRKESE